MNRHLLNALVVLFLYCPLLPTYARAEWQPYGPPQAVNGRGIYEDTISRCPAYGWRQIRSMDRATQCHEATHFINSEISGAKGQQYGAFWVGNGYAFVVAEPRVTIGVVARYVPQEKRTPRYQQYLTGDRVSRNGLAVIDEWTCYTNDAQCTRDLRLSEDGGAKFAGEFCAFADSLLAAIRQHDPAYADLAALEQFVAWQKQRVTSITGDPTPGFTTAERLRDISDTIGRITNKLDKIQKKVKPSPPQPPQLRRGPAMRFDRPWYAESMAPARIMDLPMEWRERNRNASCVFVSTANQLRHLGLGDKAIELRRRYSGGGWPSRLRNALDGLGIHYAMTTDGDVKLLDYASASGRGAGISYYGSHYVNFAGWDGGDALLLGNHKIDEFHRIPRDEFLSNWRNLYDGWATVILDGEPPPPLR